MINILCREQMTSIKEYQHKPKAVANHAEGKPNYKTSPSSYAHSRVWSKIRATQT